MTHHLLQGLDQLAPELAPELAPLLLGQGVPNLLRSKLDQIETAGDGERRLGQIEG
jgi:hypothetical protein